MAALIRKYTRLLLQGKYVLLINITDRLFSFIILLLIARNFSTVSYGHVVTMFAFSSVLLAVFDFGLPSYIQREISIRRDDPSAIFSLVFKVNILFTAPYLLLSVIFYEILYSDVPFTLFAVIIMTMYLSSLINLCSKTLSGMSEFKGQFTAFSSSRVAILIFFSAWLYFFRAGLSVLLVFMLAGFLFNLLLLILFIRRNNVKLSLTGTPVLKGIRPLLGTSIPLGVAVLFNFLYDKADVLLLSKLKDFDQVAYYSAGYGIYKASTLAFSFLLVTGFTRVSFISRRKKAVVLFLRKYAAIVFLICLAVSLVLYFGSGEIIRFLYTDRFRPAVDVLKILSFGIIALGLNNLTGIVINGIGLYKAVMYVTIFGLVINVLLNIMLIPAFGIIAASSVTVVTEYIILLFEIYILIKIL